MAIVKLRPSEAADNKSKTPFSQKRSGGAISHSLPTLDSVIITEKLNERPGRRPQYGAESRALLSLAQAIAEKPENIYNKLAQTALELCRAHSAGFSLLDESGERFYWPAIVGQWAEHIGGGTPAEFGPCGTVLERNAAQLFKRPERYFPYLAPVKPHMEEALLLPFYVNERAVGTIWIMAHDRTRRFDSEDLRIMTSLAGFASAAYQIIHAVREGEFAGALHLQNISRELIYADNPGALYDKILEAAVAIMRSDFASMQMLYAERGELCLLAFKNFHPDSAKFWEWVRPDSGSTCGVALQTHKRVIVSDVETCDFMAETDDLKFYRQSKIRAVQSTPLISRTGVLLGMISTHWSRQYSPSEHDLRLFDILARQAADVIERARAERMLQLSNDLLEERVRTRTRELEQQIRETRRAEDGLRAVTGRLFKVQDDERRFIARELHAGAGQTLAALSMNFGRMMKLAKRQEVREGLDECYTLIDTLNKEMRTLSYVLHPPLLEDLGLGFALRTYVRGFSESSGIPIQVQDEEIPTQLSKDEEIAIFRVIQESLTNIHRHSGATAAKIYVAVSDGSLRVTVTDNGKGISEERQRQLAEFAISGVGILGMRERIRQLGGSFEIARAPDDAFAGEDGDAKKARSGSHSSAENSRGLSDKASDVPGTRNCNAVRNGESTLGSGSFPNRPGTCVKVILPLTRAAKA